MNSTIYDKYNEIYSKISNLGLDKPDRFIYHEQKFYDNTPFGAYVIEGTTMNFFREAILELSKKYSNEFGENLIHRMTQARIIEPSYYISVYDKDKQLIFNLVETIITEFPNIKNKFEINSFIKDIYNNAKNIVKENEKKNKKIYNETIKTMSEMKTQKEMKTQEMKTQENKPYSKELKNDQPQNPFGPNIWLQTGSNKIK